MDRAPDTRSPGPPASLPEDTSPARGDLGVWLRYSFEPGEQQGAQIENALFRLLAAVVEGGSIRHAAQALGTSYRHAWGSLRRWEQVLGAPLITWSQGRKARPTELARRLLSAERRARTRLQPHIEALRADLGQVLASAHDPRDPVLPVCASHDLALPVLQQHLASRSDLQLDIEFQGSLDALAALNGGQCLVAGFHLPTQAAATSVFGRALAPLVGRDSHRLIACLQRTQGLMVRKEHASAVRTLADVVSQQLRFVHRQSGSGTRLLVEHLSQLDALGGLSQDTAHVENTHVSVALCVAGGVADAGVGVEAAALQFGLHFVPLIEESYFLACLAGDTEHSALVRLREILAGERWRTLLTSLPGYRPAPAPGALLTVEEALGW